MNASNCVGDRRHQIQAVPVKILSHLLLFAVKYKIVRFPLLSCTGKGRHSVNCLKAVTMFSSREKLSMFKKSEL